MKGLSFSCGLLLLFAAVMSSADESGIIAGRIDYDGERAGAMTVRCYRLHVTSAGDVRQLSKREIYGDAEPLMTLTLEGPGRYEFGGLPDGFYSVLAFMDRDGDGELGFDPPEPFGWFAAEPGGWVDPIEPAGADVENADFSLRTPTPFPRDEQRCEHGALRWMRGLPVLQLRGSAEERGYAHGYLVGRQIIDFFEFYVLEDSWRSARRYLEEFVPFLDNNFDYPPEYLREVDAVVEGMRDSGIEMEVEALGSDFGRAELLAINSYIERRAAYPSPGASSCTQFAFWGAQTEGSELGGGLIAGRNMDGEVDARKVTVSHFLIFAVEPSEPGRRRWVSMMWPGFVGTITGINEEGLYCMENAGGTGPGPVVGGLTPMAWVQRYALETAGADATPGSIAQIMAQFASEGGGTCGPGSITLWAVPYSGQDAPGFVYEGDRFGGAMRGPTDVRPVAPTNIMASNHHQVYGVDPDRPGYYFGKPAYFSSLWRYEAGMNMIEAWTRAGRPVGTAEMKQLLQTVGHGTTEYAVIFRANDMSIDVAVDDLATDMWDAPFLRWVTFDFEELHRR